MSRLPLLRNNNEFLGLTLIELMVVIAIIGLCASIAIPSAQTLFIRAKQAERDILLGRLENDLKNYYGIHGGFPSEYIWNPDCPDKFIGVHNPPPDWNYPNGISPKKKMTFDNNMLNWRLIGTSFERGSYYHYEFCASAHVWPEPTWFGVVAIGDLDGDGIVSIHTHTWNLAWSRKWYVEEFYEPNRWEP